MQTGFRNRLEPLRDEMLAAPGARQEGLVLAAEMTQQSGDDASLEGIIEALCHPLGYSFAQFAKVHGGLRSLSDPGAGSWYEYLSRLREEGLVVGAIKSQTEEVSPQEVPVFLFHCAISLHAAGETCGGIEVLDELLRRYPEHIVALEHQAHFSEIAGNAEQYGEALTRLGNIAPWSHKYSFSQRDLLRKSRRLRGLATLTKRAAGAQIKMTWLQLEVDSFLRKSLKAGLS